ncbi:hypothetical protein BO71DRAFT_75552 [Aspergillus ellipticus CBS 707.79]|uniref:Uncharacterized protein n=1 Tax=Aspergillus ellipticus CBS 707.79 TaxID=1448320 RepID=A0A319CZT0_9EURO|nr:hypothetical protein BO71DRAFT_75552 [Aspergillus ellipticus CBS 707.79]
MAGLSVCLAGCLDLDSHEGAAHTRVMARGGRSSRSSSIWSGFTDELIVGERNRFGLGWYSGLVVQGIIQLVDPFQTRVSFRAQEQSWRQKSQIQGAIPSPPVEATGKFRLSPAVSATVLIEATGPSWGLSFGQASLMGVWIDRLPGLSSRWPPKTGTPRRLVASGGLVGGVIEGMPRFTAQAYPALSQMICCLLLERSEPRIRRSKSMCFSRLADPTGQDRRRPDSECSR